MVISNVRYYIPILVNAFIRMLAKELVRKTAAKMMERWVRIGGEGRKKDGRAGGMKVGRERDIRG